MAVREIRIVPDPVLRRKARTVKVIDAAIRRLARDMIETMQAARGVGLAANQVGELVRVVTIQMPEEEPFVMINPVITHREGTRRRRGLPQRSWLHGQHRALGDRQGTVCG